MMNEIIKIEVPQEVKIRKYEVDISSLQNILRESKNKLKLTNKQIAKTMNVPLTQVEHWFRTDKYFAIPDDNLWYKLKSLLNIDTDVFDKSIMEFEYREGVFEKTNRCYFEEGIAPTLTCACGDEKVIVYE